PRRSSDLVRFRPAPLSKSLRPQQHSSACAPAHREKGKRKGKTSVIAFYRDCVIFRVRTHHHLNREEGPDAEEVTSCTAGDADAVRPRAAGATPPPQAAGGESRGARRGARARGARPLLEQGGTKWESIGCRATSANHDPAA